MTKTKQRIVEAVQRGYRVTEAGVVLGPKGALKLYTSPKKRYPTITTNWGGCVYSIPAHQLAAYCFYGDTYLSGTQCVRHVDGDVLNLSRTNIVLGSYSENERDKPELLRKQVAKFARAAQGFTPTNAKLTAEQVRNIRKVYASFDGSKLPNGVAAALCAKYGVSRTVLHKVKTKEYYSNVG